MILGTICSRHCRFCNVASGQLDPPDPEEPLKVAKAIYEMDEKADYYAQFAGQQIYMKIIFDLKLI